MEHKQNYGLRIKNYGIVVIVILIDQVSKYFARKYFPVTENPGLPFFGIDLPGVLDVISIILLFGIFVSYYFKHYRPQISAGFYFIAGGAVSNIVDRLSKATVTDFINLGIGNTFNFADVAIMIGIGILLMSNIKAQKSKI